MTDPRDRLLHHALGEVMGESSEADPDLSRTIREAWERGERRPAPRIVRRSDRSVEAEAEDEFESVRRTPRSTRPSTSRRRPRRDREEVTRNGPRPMGTIAAAAAVLALGGTLAFLVTRDGADAPQPGTTVADSGGPKPRDVQPTDTDPVTPGAGTEIPIEDIPVEVAPAPVLARSDRPLRVDGAPDRTSEIDLGQIAYVPTGAAATVALPGDGELVAEPGTVFTLEGRRSIALGTGVVRVAAAAESVALAMPGDALLEIPTGSAIRVALRLDRRPAGAPDLASWLAESGAMANGVLDVNVERGTAQLTLAGGQAVELPSAGEPAIYLLARGELRHATPEELLVSDVLLELGNKALAPNARLELARGMYSEGTFLALREAPELWPLAEHAVATLLDPRQNPAYVRGEVVGSLSVDESPFAVAALRRAWVEDPEVFSTNAIVALAERGLFEFEREAKGWFDAWDEDAESEPFPIALYLALRDDAGGERFLRAALETDVKGDAVGLPLIAAAGLMRLGDSAAWAGAVEAHAEEIRTLLAAGDLEQAALRVDILAYALALRDGELLDGSGADASSRREPRVGFLAHWLDAFRRQRNEQVRDAAALEEELRSLEAI